MLYTFFFFNDPPPTEIYTLSLHDALPICGSAAGSRPWSWSAGARRRPLRSEEHTSELQSRENLVCRLLLEKKKNNFSESSSAVSAPQVLRHGTSWRILSVGC